MRCPECRGRRLEQGLYDFAQLFRQQPVMLRNVPGHRCVQCGYLLLSSDVLQRIETALLDWSTGRPNMVPAFVFDLSGEAAASETTGTFPVEPTVATNLVVV